MMNTPTGNRDLIRAINRSHVLNAIKARGQVGRADIARLTGLSPATVTAITAELIEENLVQVLSPGDSRGGRPPILLAINPRGGYVIGIKLTEENATCALTDLEATILAKLSTTLSGHEPKQVVNDLAKMVLQLIKENDVHDKPLLGVGIGLGGIVDVEQGILRQSPIYGDRWSDVHLRDMLENKLKVPVYLENDVNTLTMTEKWFGSGQGLDNFLTVTVGRGIGMGIVVNGQFYRGQGGGAGELGHTVIDPNGPQCACGKRGCLEAYIGDPGLVRLANEAAARGELPNTVVSVDELLVFARSGNPKAIEIYAFAGRILGQAIANLINILNPQRIILSGEGTCAGDLLFGPMRESIQQNTMPGLFSEKIVQVDPWGDDAWARGAAGFVLHKTFESPMRNE
jgi:predicted NBD/HSP70 family sugar kinase